LSDGAVPVFGPVVQEIHSSSSTPLSQTFMWSDNR
jgi:hypothetical protein